MTEITKEQLLAAGRSMQKQPECNCISRSPSYPTYRDSPHLPDCVWWHIEQLEKRITELEKPPLEYGPPWSYNR